MNAEVVKAPLVLPERLCAVEVGQGDFFEQHPPWKRNSSALQPDGSLVVSTAGSIFVSANDPALINGSNTRYASSSLLKNAQTWRVSPSWEPAKEIGATVFFMVYSSHLLHHR